MALKSEEELSKIIKPAALEIDDSFDSGLRYSLYKSDTDVKFMDDLLKLKPVSKNKACRYFKHDGHSAGNDKNYGLVYDGYFYSDTDQTITFGLTSNDGSRLYLDDQLVIDNDGTHEATEKQVTLKLKKGLYKFRLEYFQQLMARELILCWKNKAGKMVPIQEKFFYRKKVRNEAGAIKPSFDISPGNFGKWLKIQSLQKSGSLKEHQAYAKLKTC